MNLWDSTLYLIVAALLIFIGMSVYTWYQNQVIKAYRKDFAEHEMFDDFIEPKWR